MNQIQLSEIVAAGPKKFAQWLVQHNFLNSFCKLCAQPMTVVDSTKFHLDKVCFWCDRCCVSVSVRQHTIWEKKHLSLEVCFHLLIAFKSKASCAVASREWGVSKVSVGKLFYEFKMLVVTFMKNPYIHKMLNFTKSGNGIYEIDESIIVHVKTTSGTKIQWIFGIYEQETGKVFLERIANRKAQTLIPLIKKHVPFWSVVCTDSLTSYNSLNKRYFHYKVDHNIGDYSHEDKLPTGKHFTVTTNSIEQIWNSLKGPIHPKKKTIKEIDRQIQMLMFNQMKFPFENLVKPKH